MYFGVYLIESGRNILVPAKWLFRLNAPFTANNGVLTTEEHLIFYSKDASKNADFLAPIAKRFDENVDACYHGNIVKVFGKSIVIFLRNSYLYFFCFI